MNPLLQVRDLTVAFGRHAQVMEIDELTGLDAMYDKGTNLHHALMLATRFFRWES